MIRKPTVFNYKNYEDLLERTRWIPVSERLPEVNILQKGQYGDPDWYTSKPVVVITEDNRLDPLSRYEVVQYEQSIDGEPYDCWGGDFWLKREDIIAWLPLPEPYKGGDDE